MNYKKVLFSFLVGFFSLSAACLAEKKLRIVKFQEEPSAPGGEFAPPAVPLVIDVNDGELLVKFKSEETDLSQRKKIFQELNCTIADSIIYDEEVDDIVYVITLNDCQVHPEDLKACDNISKVLKALRGHSAIEYAEPNIVRKASFTPDDPLYKTGATEEYEGSSKFENQWYIDKTGLDSAWDITKGNSSVLVGICDDGIAATHEDLSGKVVKQYDFNSNDTSAAHSSGDIGHGTHVAGIVGAIKNNSKGIAGVSDSKFLIAKVLGPDGGTDAAVANGIKWCADNGAKVINLSLGGAGTSATLGNAVAYAYSKGVVVVAAAGNEALDGNPVSYPAAYDNVIGVAATDKNDARGSFSNYGTYVDIAAPGVEILSTIPKSLSTANTGDTNGSGYTAWDGTSMATPFLAGVVSLLFAVNPALSPEQVENALYTTAKDLGTAGKDKYYGWGRVQPLNALQALSSSPPPPTSGGAVLISQFTTRGQASASDEFVELYNPTANSVSLSGYKLQYKSATGTSWSTRLTFPAGVSIPAGKYYLTANSAGYVSGTSGPGPDRLWDSTSGIADNGHLRIIDSAGTEIDKAGYGSASFPEGGTPGAPNHGTSANSKSTGRKTDGVDSNVNRNDFAVRTSRAPKNSSGTVATTSGSGSASLSKTGVAPNTFYTSITYTLTPTSVGSLGDGTVTVQIPAGWQSPQNQYSASPGYVKSYIYKYQTTSVPLTTSVSGQKITITGIPASRLAYGSGDKLKLSYKKFTTQLTAGTATFATFTAGSGGTLSAISKQPTVSVDSSYTTLRSDVDTEVESEEGGVKPAALGQNFPNPFNPATTFNYFISDGGRVLIKLYNVAGQEVDTIIDEDQTQGEHSVKYDSGDRLSRGVYYYRLTLNGKEIGTKRAVVLK